MFKQLYTSMAEVNKARLQERILELETRIAEATAQRKVLEENSKNAKAEVNQSIGNQLERLRQREVQLNRQVDALIGHQGSLLQLQLARLYQELGSLRAAHSYGHQPEILACTERELTPSIPVRRLQYMAPTEEELSTAIQSFGCFEAALGQSRPSVLLLPDEEAYEDAEHQLMHKSLQDKMQWTFPKPPVKREDWLQSTRIEDYEMSDCESIELLCPSEIQDKEFWLLGSKSSSKSCMCEEKGTIEIENLSTLSCTNRQSSSSVLPIPEVSTACQSHQSNKCSSFRDCNCPENCLLVHLREQTKRLWLEEPQKTQDCINNTLKEALKTERSLWLNKGRKKNENSDWLLKRKSDESNVSQALSEGCQSLKKQMKELYFDSNSAGWVADKNIRNNEGWLAK